MDSYLSLLLNKDLSKRCWTIDSEGNDSEAVLAQIYDVGLRGMMSNDILGLVEWAAKQGRYIRA